MSVGTISADSGTPDRNAVSGPVPAAGPASTARPCVRGKFLYVGEHKLYLRGMTYGPFRPDDGTGEYGTPESVRRDFALMAESGVNAVRTYTVPPRWLLDTAVEHGLWVLVGLPWEQHIAFLDTRSRRASIERRMREGVRECAGHPAVLGFAVGNEIPAQIVRWYGRRRVERFLRRLHRAAKSEDRGALVTYVNFPTTEYLQLPFLDFVCFNVYLEAREDLSAYVARLQNLAGDRPLVMAEFGLDSRGNGLASQATSLDWQLRTVFTSGCAGAFVFAWTDEWHRGGFDVDDWDFGVTDRSRRPKPALDAVRRAFADVPMARDAPWPKISVLVCTHNGAATLRDTCEGLTRLHYPDYEVIVVDDGSTDATPEIVREFGFRLIRTENRGLSSARNTALAAATGEIVAYIDDDAWPDPHWLTYLAATFADSDHVGVGGPNLAPPGDGPIAACVARAPGGPTHVLLSDGEAEHIPGCNMAFRREALEAIGGFDPTFRIAGDDVDVCWRLQEQGGTLGFSPAAVVWHHQRNSVRAFYRQQRNYGRAEGMLERKWPEKYNPLGHLRWKGRLYGNGADQASVYRRWRVYHGVWGTGPFQSLYEKAPGTFLSLLLMPEWYLVVAGLAGLSLLGSLWRPFTLAAPVLAVAVAAPFAQAVARSWRAPFPPTNGSMAGTWGLRALTALLHLLQPLARLSGRLQHGLTPWRRRGRRRFAIPRPRETVLWSETWQHPQRWLETLEAELLRQGALVRRGGPFDRWDLETRCGSFGNIRTRMAIEEHGAGRQLVRFRAWPRPAPLAATVSVLLAVLAAAAVVDGVWTGATMLALAAILVAGRIAGDCGLALANHLEALDRSPARKR